MSGKEAMNIALAGVGNPIKFSAWRVSLLNFASLSAEKTDIRKAMKFKYGLILGICGDCKNISYIMADGKNPKLTISASESRSFPIPEKERKTREANPSKKSKIAARNKA